MILATRLNLILDDFVRFKRISTVVTPEYAVSLKLITFFKLRYGIGFKISKLLILHMGYLPNILLSQLAESFVTYPLRQFFLAFKDSLDVNTKSYMFHKVQEQMTLRTLRGLKLLAGLPCRGQRRRSNANTARKNRMFVNNTNALS